MLIWAIRRIQLHAAVKTKVPFPCWILAGGCSQLLEAALLPLHLFSSIFKSATMQQILFHVFKLWLSFLLPVEKHFAFKGLM